jgi:hypothetical protein
MAYGLAQREPSTPQTRAVPAAANAATRKLASV